MPFKIIQTSQGFRLYNLHKKEYAKPVFKTKQSAARAGLNFMRYRHERGKLVGNQIVKI